MSSRLVEGRLSYQFLNGLHQCHEKWNKTRIRMVLHVSTKSCGTASIIRDMFLYESKLLQCYADSACYPRDAYGARVLAMALCSSVTSRSSIKRGERINLVFGPDASFDQYYTVF